MKWLWTKTKQLADDWFNLIVIGILCAGLLFGLYVQGISHEVRVNHLLELQKKEVNIYKEQSEKMRSLNQEIIKAYSKEKASSEIKTQIIQKQYNMIQDLFKKLQEYKDWFEKTPVDPDTIT